jgi:hypothetical protein
MTDEQVDRLVEAFERMAGAAEGIYETQRREHEKRWPAAGERREAIVTRVPSEEDRIREEQGAGGGSLKDWLGLEDEEFAGVREREFVEAERRRQQAAGSAGGAAVGYARGDDGPVGRCPEAAEGEA